MGKYTVVRYGTDTSGRGIYMTRNQHAYWQAVLDSPRIEPFADKVTVVQGAWMVKNGGGADDSAGYHDFGGPLDIRTWNLLADELNRLIVAIRLRGGAGWRRDAAHGGFDPHIHLTIDRDGKMDSGVVYQFNAYESGGYGSDGMHGYDYEWRPKPIRHWRWKRTKPRQKINLTVLLTAWGRDKGTSYGKGKVTLRRFAKALQRKGFLDHYKFKDARYGKTLRDAVAKANRHYGIKDHDGKDHDRPTWKLCRELGLAPYKVEKKIKGFTK